MEATWVRKKARREFDNVTCLMAIIPALVFVYLIVGKIASFTVLAGEIGYVMLAVVLLILLGIITGKRLLWSLINKIIDFDQQIISLKEEMVEKNRIAAVSETVLSLSHEINNPLLVIQGSLSVLEEEQESPPALKNRLVEIRSHCERIMQVTNKMSSLSKPILTKIHGDIKMVDLGSSE